VKAIGILGWLYARAKTFWRRCWRPCSRVPLQIAFRYLFNFPVGWTQEVSVIMWIWMVLFGAAFVVREEEEIRFDLIYSAVGPARTPRHAALVCRRADHPLRHVASGRLDYVTFMKVESTAYLKIRFDWLYSIYIIFVVAVIAAISGCRGAMFGEAPEEVDPTKASSGV
jgi:C4-dicarboxylate transporter DctQ subunit